MKRHLDIALKASIVALSAGSLLLAGLPVGRHLAGIVVVPTEPRFALPELKASEARDLSALFEKAPFGRAVSLQTAQNAKDGALPDLVLKGIFASEASLSAALLAVSGQTDLYRQNDQVTAGFVLTRVAKAHVELENGDQKLSLYFDDALQEAQDSETPQHVAQTPDDLMARMGGDMVVPERYQPRKPPETTSEYIDYWRYRIRKNPAVVLQTIGLEPTDQGYIIAEKHDVGVKLAGLKSGDLVRSINGQEIGNPDQDRRLYDKIAASGQARLEVERDGQLLTFSFPLR